MEWEHTGKFPIAGCLLDTVVDLFYSRESFDLIQLKKDPAWKFVPESKVTLSRAHGSEIVRSFCFLDSVS